MLVRIIGIADQTVNVDKADYLAAKREKRLHEFMQPYIDSLMSEVTFGPAEDFD